MPKAIDQFNRLGRMMHTWNYSTQEEILKKYGLCREFQVSQNYITRVLKKKKKW